MNELDNLEIVYYDNGRVQCILERNSSGVMHGVRINWSRQGVMTQESYYDTWNKHGVCNSWYDCGTMKEKATYIHGKIHGLFQYWYPSGQLMEQSNWHYGQRHGKDQVWNSSGVEQEVVYYSFDIDVTEGIYSVVANIDNITDYERTQVALLYGVTL